MWRPSASATTDRARRRRAGPCRAPASTRRRAARASEDLPEALGPMTPRPCPALSAKATSCTTRRWRARRRGADALHRQARARRRQRHRFASAAARPPSSSTSRCQLWRARDEALPVGDRQLDRRERARGQDRARDDDAGGRLLLDHEIGADARAPPTAAPCAAPSRRRRGRRRRRRRAAGVAMYLALASPQSAPIAAAHAHGRAAPRRCAGSPPRERCARHPGSAAALRRLARQTLGQERQRRPG